MKNVNNAIKMHVPNVEKDFIMTIKQKIMKHVLVKLRVVQNVKLMVAFVMNANKNKTLIFTWNKENAKEFAQILSF